MIDVTFGKTDYGKPYDRYSYKNYDLYVIASGSDVFKVYTKKNSTIIHRLDGPAIIKHYELKKFWYINGFFITDLISDWAREREIDLDNLTPLDKCAIAMEFSNYNWGQFAMPNTIDNYGFV